MRNILVVVDMQTDFVDGALGTPEAVGIVPAVKARIEAAAAAGDKVYFTRDTHTEGYMDTQEGRLLPVPHCIRGTEGWQIVPALREYAAGAVVIDKPGFGSTLLQESIRLDCADGRIGQITLIGLCTDICVISNALLIKAAVPEVPVHVAAACCAGVSPESHSRALEAMGVCQIVIES